MSSAATSSWGMGGGIPAPSMPMATHELSTPIFASRREAMHGDGGFIPVSGQTNFEEFRNIKRTGAILERTVRVKASRTMKRAWSIPYTRYLQAKSSRDGQWSNRTVTSGYFTFAIGDTFSNEFIMNAASTIVAGGAVALRPGRSRPPGATTWTTANTTTTTFTGAEAVEWLTIDKFDLTNLLTTTTNDPDRDGVTTALENEMGTLKDVRNTDGAGYADGDQINLNLLPPANGLVISTRSVEYIYSPEDPICPGHPANRLSLVRDLPAGNVFIDPNGPKLGIDDSFHNTLNTQLALPAQPPGASALPILTTTGTDTVKVESSTQMTYSKLADGLTETVTGEQRRIWGQLAEAPAANLTTTYIKVRRETKNPATSPATVTTTSIVTFNFTPVSAQSTNFIDLLSKRTSNGTGSVVSEALLPVEIVDRDNNIISELMVGTMTNGGVINGSESSATLDIDKESNRFFVRVKGGAALEGILVKVSTTDNPDAAYNDNATQIGLVADGADATSKTMLVVPDDADDVYPVDSVADDSPSFDGTGDRTHKVQLGGNFNIEGIKIGNGEWQNCNCKWGVPVKKTVHLNVVILKATAGGDPVIDLPSVEKEMKEVQERYAQAGIRVTYFIAPPIDPPTGVILSNGLSEFRGPSGPTDEEVALISGAGTPFMNDIHVFYINYFTPTAYDDGSYAEAFLESTFGAPMGENIITTAKHTPRFSSTDPLQPQEPIHFLVAHELGHILKKDPYHPLDFKLIMRLGGTSSSNTIGASKRFTGREIGKMLKSPHAN